MVGKSVSLDLDDLKKVNKKIKKGEFANFSEFVRKAMKKELKGGEYAEDPR
jgi:Arc/MetJ-type ribon-helix-helix transcriptional regulator